ncbi:MAG: cytochrome P450 [Blastochloris sp.]|nr:cytochrome P450 [Blastochloris sp.]
MTTYRLPPGPAPVRSLWQKIQTTWNYNRNGIHLLMATQRQYGDVYNWQMDDNHLYIIVHPDDIHRVLVTDAASYHKTPDYTDPDTGLAMFLGSGILTSDGEFWRRQRKLMQPAFHTKRIEAYADIMVEQTEQMLERWASYTRLDIDQEMMRLTLLIVAQALFHNNVEAEADLIGEGVTALQYANAEAFLPRWLPTPNRWRARRVLVRLNEIIYRLIRERRESGIVDKGDLLSMLLLAQDDDGVGMTDKQIRDEVMTIILAGHETTANAMNWTWYLLSQHREVEAKLHVEVDTVLGGRLPTLADLKQMPYAEW